MTKTLSNKTPKKKARGIEPKFRIKVTVVFDHILDADAIFADIDRPNGLITEDVVISELENYSDDLYNTLGDWNLLDRDMDDMECSVEVTEVSENYDN